MTDTLYALSAGILQQCKAVEEDLDAVLSRETGFAPRLSALYRQTIQKAHHGTLDADISESKLEMLRMESNTWDLLQVLTPLRKLEEELPPTARELLAQNPYTPTATLAQVIMKHSPFLGELVAVREWLHDSAPIPHPPEATTGYWKMTKHRLLQGLRTGNKKELAPLVTALDPDAPVREIDGKSLAADDANYEKALTQALYGYIRAGRLADAVELCRSTYRPWRAASIRGSLLFRWRALSTATSIESDEDGEDVDYAEGWSGNKRRKLWKATCTQAATNPLLPESERALYAALAPSASTSTALTSSCRTWEDHLWAQISIICEEKQSLEMSRAAGFWEEGAEAVERAVDYVDPEDAWKDYKRWEQEAVENLETLASRAVAEGLSAQDPFHVAQLHIILGRTDKLLTDFATGLQTGDFNPDQPNYATLSRFFAHLCLFLQMVDIDVPPLAAQVILEVYLQVLESAGQREYIAMYVSALGDNAIERYALFLSGLDNSVSIEERRLALRRAEDHGLDIIKVAQVTAEKALAKALEALPSNKMALPSVTALETSLSEEEWFLIRTIEWTVFMEETYPDALKQANAIFRYFLGAGKVQTADILRSLLPYPLRQLNELRSQSVENYHYTQFFEIWDALKVIPEVQAKEPQFPTKSMKTAWILELKDAVNTVHDRIIDLLTGDWLQADDELDGASQVLRVTFTRLRRIYIPELVIQLHALLVNTSQHIEGNLKRAFDLVNVVADLRYRLYDDFTGGEGERLKDYLSAVRSAVLKGLESGGSHPFRILELSS